MESNFKTVYDKQSSGNCSKHSTSPCVMICKQAEG